MRSPVGALLAALCAVALLTTACSGDTHQDWRQEMPDHIVISTGNSSGIYAAYGARFAELIEDDSDTEVDVEQSGGSIENIKRLASGQTDLTFSAADALVDATQGRGQFDEPVPLRSLGRIYDDFMHLVVPDDSAITDLQDLRGKRVAMGAPASGTALISHRVFRAAKLPVSAIDARALSLSEAIDHLRSGKIDAFFWSGGLRTPALTQLADVFPFRLVPLGKTVDRVRKKFGSGYRHGTMLPGTYGLPDEIPTLAVPNMLVVRADASNEFAAATLDALFDNREAIARAVPAASLLDRAKAIFTSPVALHPGAISYYRDAVR